MAIAAQSLSSYGPSQIPVGQGTVLAYGGSDNQETAYNGTVTFILDGSTTTATINFIDGTNGIFFNSSAVAPGATVTFVAPSAVTANVVGGTQPAAAFVSVSTEAITTTGCTVRFSTAGTNLNTLKLAITIYR